MSEFTFLGQNIPRLTLLVGGALVVEGLGFYFGTGMTSMTSMIPAFWPSFDCDGNHGNPST